jgi:uncharacterized cupin superfamily protein
MTVAHWDEVDWRHNAKGEMDATWQRLGDAAGARGVGVHRVRVEHRKLPTPPHSHGALEELYFVLAGSGHAWQDGEVYEVRPLDCVIQRPDEMEHTFVAGDHGLEYLVFGTRHPTELGWLPRSRAIRFGWPWGEGRDDDPWDVEATVEPLAYGSRAAAGEHRERRRGRAPDRAPPDIRLFHPGRATKLAGLGWETLPPGHRAPFLTAIRRRKRSSSSSRARQRSSSGHQPARSRRRRFAPAMSSRGLPAPASPTPSAPGRTA